ncbi:uncharacterized protein si:ch211-151h10.2 isoform X1 [Labrus mixtus]|uniref:uncharacterized protein si:ch211-151h10.2 isoform X1 n=2 Tax=Labrus mixtus TaxID=508554 RepID=UPI0029C0D12D|nr:uncharacterized protein si:ch211-151h10.2 isoform X1 [Labrus mixtus]
MPLLMVSHHRGQEGSGQAERGGWDGACKWTEEVMEDGEGEVAERSWNLESLRETLAAYQPQEISWSQIRRKLPHWNLNFRGCYSFALVAAVWSVCQVEAPLHPSVLLVDVCWRLVLVCSVWMGLGGCVHALKSSLRPGQTQGERAQRMEEEVVSENRNIQYSWKPQRRSPGPGVPLDLALADSLLLCLLQEPLRDPTVPNIKTQICRLESVFYKLEEADIGSDATLEEMDYNSKLTDKVKLIRNYLQKRMSSLCRLVQVQGDFESSVKDMLEGLDGLWAQLEELHTGVTLSKEGSQGHRDLASALTDAETLFAVLGRYRKRLQRCQSHLKESTQLLQELIWSHTHIRNSVSSSSESVWPELLLQSNIEQFDKVQENFLSMEQQTSTFQAHLEGLGKGHQDGNAGLIAHSGSVSPQTSLHLHGGRTNLSQEHQSLPSASEKNTDTEKNPLLLLCERSALQFSSTISRLRKSVRRK